MRISANNKGMALVWVMIAMMIVLNSIVVGSALLVNTSNILSSQMEYYGEAPSIAKSGLFDAQAYFRRQTNQPVTSFNPQRDLEAIPIVNDTDDPTIGIVRELDVDQSSHIYGRYEVISSTVIDTSSQRGFPGNGTMWYIESMGYIFLKLDPSQSYNVFPNRVVACICLGTEIRRVSMVLPAQSALCAGAPSQTIIGKNTKIIGNTKCAIAYPPDLGTPNIHNEALVTGTPATSLISPYYDSCDAVFGMSESELRSIADYYVTSVSDLPSPIPDYKIVFFEGNASFNFSIPLKGTGIFYITGNMTIAANSGSSYNGIIYCKGNYHQRAPSTINGSIIAKNQLNIQSTGDISEVNYDPNVLQQVQTYTGQYRFAKGFYEVK